VGQKLFNLDSEKLSACLVQDNPEIKVADIQKQLDGTITVNLVPREPLGVFVSGGNNYVFDDSGVVYKKVSDPGSLTPVILLGAPDIYLNTSVLSPAALSAVDVLVACRENDFKVSQIKDLDGFLSLQTPEGPLIWLPLKKTGSQIDYSDAVQKFREIVRQAKLEQKDISKVDFRYLKIVVE